MRTRKQPPSAFNKIPRRAGKFWSYQAAGFAAMEHQPLFIYAAMFDEVDEGTAMFKAASTLAETPAAPAQFLYLSVDGTSVPSDFYLSLSGNFTANWRHKRGAAPNASSAEAAVWGDAERRESYELARRLTESISWRRGSLCRQRPMMMAQTKQPRRRCALIWCSFSR